ncbi:hypothetical protein [Brevundimonas sp. Leaf363]|uniref:hypothetical protein n=1 Tax=Brevundimonas sp. Leaf363 TaxID=1736353 RepID=UPI0012E1D8C7|nr:hypothetical protein [Brevundimonas sp. Leaf363]
MTPRTVEECLAEARKLIAEAVPEQDEMRRTALLAMADHWIALHASRKPEP